MLPLTLLLATILTPYLSPTVCFAQPSSSSDIHTTNLIRRDDDLPTRPPPFNKTLDDGDEGYYPRRLTTTDSAITIPYINFLTWTPACDDGLLYFITPRGYSLSNPGPMILNSRGEMLWSHHFDKGFGGQAYDFQVQTYKGEEYLSFWLGDDRIRGHGAGSYYMLNASYDIVHQVSAVNGLAADLHEFLITPEGTALMTMYEVVPSPSDLSVFREFHPEDKKTDDKHPNWIWDCLFQEVDIETGELVFEWRASEHVNISDTWHNIGPGGNKKDPFDWFHINSIAKDEAGNYLISARYTHSITYVDGRTGDVIWILGGKSNQFMDLTGGSLDFAWQHDARFLPEDAFKGEYTPTEAKAGFETRLISFFDNSAEDQHYEYGLAYSRGLLLEVTYPTPPPSSSSSSSTQSPPKNLNEAAEALYQPDLTLERRNDDLNDAKVLLINGTSPQYTVRVVKSYENPSKIRSSSQGSMQLLHYPPPPSPSTPSEPKILVGYGLNPIFTEFGLNGSVLCDAHFGARTSWERGDIQSYRAYKFAWEGRPRREPKTVFKNDTEIYVSWNGATALESWELQGSRTGASWTPLERKAKRDWETRFGLAAESKGFRYFRLLALDSSGQSLEFGTSGTLDRGIMVTYAPSLHDRLPAAVTGSSFGRVVFLLLVGCCVFFVLYMSYRWYLKWSYGRGYAGAWRWRGGKVGGLLSDG